MTRNPILSLLIAGLLLAAVSLLFTAPSAASPEAIVRATEASLNPAGAAFEINRDPAGALWVSDYEIGVTGQGEVWQINPASGAYTLYRGMNAPSDARSDGAGTLWWADFDNKRIGRLSPGQTKADMWQLEGSGGLYGTALDGSGRFWATDTGSAAVHSLNPSDNRLCTYGYPATFATDYLVARQANIWFADGFEHHLYRLEPAGPSLTQWDLPENSNPVGLAFDSSDRLWYADPTLRVLARFDPTNSQLTTFALPAGRMPQMIAAEGERIWFSEASSSRALGLLDPLQASGNTQTLLSENVSVTSACVTHRPDLTLPVVVSQGTLQWTNTTYPRTTLAAGIWAAELPVSAYSRGVAVDDHGAWLVDSGRQLLVRVLPASTSLSYVYLPLVVR